MDEKWAEELLDVIAVSIKDEVKFQAYKIFSFFAAVFQHQNHYTDIIIKFKTFKTPGNSKEKVNVHYLEFDC